MPYSDEELEEIARIVRVDLELDDQIKLDVVEFLRRLKRHRYISDYVCIPDHLLQDAEAKFNPAERKIYLRNSVCAGAEAWNDHHRFTIIHEGAHALLNHRHERKRSYSAVAFAERKVSSIARDEGEANRLAAAIISPSHRANFSLETTVEQLMQRFGLTRPAAIKRWETLSRIYRRRHNLPRPLPPGVIDFLAKRQREGHRVSSLPTDEIASFLKAHPKYGGDACPNCHNFTLIRIGTHQKCDRCGATTGDD